MSVSVELSRQWRRWTLALSVVSGLCLLLQAVRAVMVLQLYAPSLEDHHTSAEFVDSLLKWTYVATALAELTWLYVAYALAARRDGAMRYTPAQAVLLLVLPVLNLLFGIPVAYELWRRSGAPERSRLILVWWSFWISSFYLSVVWYFTYLVDVWFQAIFVGSTLCFLILAARITHYQLAQLAGATLDPVKFEKARVPVVSPERRAGWTLDGDVDPSALADIENDVSRHTETLERGNLSAPAPVVVIRRPAPPPGAETRSAD